MTHPGDDWPRRCPRNYDKPILPLHGERGIFAAWPPSARCEGCDAALSAGYMYPAERHMVTFPDSRIRFLCEQCARENLRLRDHELYGHKCGKLCLDVRHAETRLVTSHLLDKVSDAERIEHFQHEFSSFGWRVDVVEPTVIGVRSIGGDWWDVWIVPQRDLPWPPGME